MEARKKTWEAGANQHATLGRPGDGALMLSQRMREDTLMTCPCTPGQALKGISHAAFLSIAEHDCRHLLHPWSEACHDICPVCSIRDRLRSLQSIFLECVLAFAVGCSLLSGRAESLQFRTVMLGIVIQCWHHFSRRILRSR